MYRIPQLLLCYGVVLAVALGGCESGEDHDGHDHDHHEEHDHHDDHSDHDHHDDHDDHDDHGDHDHHDDHDDHSDHGEHQDHHDHHDDHDHHAGEIYFPEEYQANVGLETGEVGRRALSPSFSVYASVEPTADGKTTVEAPFAGHLAAPAEALVEIGDEVQAGDLIAYISPRLEAGEVSRLASQLETAQTEADRHQREVERVEQLVEDGAVPERRLQDARSDLDVAQTELERARRQYRQFDASTPESVPGPIAIRSPISGTVRRRPVVDNAFVSAGSTVVEVVDDSAVWLVAYIHEHDLGRIDNPAGIWISDGDDIRDFEFGQNSRLVDISTVIDSNQRTAEMTVEIPEPDDLNIGEFVDAHIYGADSSEMVVVERSAPIEDQGIDIVFVQRDDERFERRVVRLGRSDRQWVEVVDGLDVGERVVSEGAYYVHLASRAEGEVGHGHSH